MFSVSMYKLMSFASLMHQHIRKDVTYVTFHESFTTVVSSTGIDQLVCFPK
jgi:hypothetical protein